MKKYGIFLMMALLAFSLTGCDPCKENLFTKLGDKLATLGKEGVEKDKILVERNAARASKCAEQGAGDMKKKMGF